MTVFWMAPRMQGRITMECKCIESRIAFRQGTALSEAVVRYKCAAKEHKAPRYALPVLKLCLPAPEARTGGEA